MTGLADAVAHARVLVTTGSGGVGKTTLAAALGVAAARAGRHAMVVTIDPARRLAQALGLAELAAEPGHVLDTPAGGRLDAMMLDMQTTFDEVVDRHATTPAQAEQIKSNRIYRTLSSSLTGTQEYMAMEKLYDLHERDRWDLVVVDTPPSRSALDFLDAPDRMTSLVDGPLLRLFLRPASAAGHGVMRLAGRGAGLFMRVAGRVTGVEVLDDLSDFFANFEGMYSGFTRRAADVRTLLREPSSRFVVVATPEPAPLREARWFVRRMDADGLHLAAIVLNRVTLVDRDHDPDDLERAAALLRTADADGRALGDAVMVLARRARIAAHDAATIADGTAELRDRPTVVVPRAGHGINDLDDLAALGDLLAPA